MSVEEIILHLLKVRGISQPEHFLAPDFERDIHDPLLLPGMERATEILAEAVRLKQVVTIFGDYDADGLPATALMVRGLKRLGLEALGIIPTRAEGYGLTARVIEKIQQAGTQLLITVDNGTVAVKEVEALAVAGIKTIICDHHEPGEHPVAKAEAVINPKLPGSAYPFRELCGAALAWKLLVATYQLLQVDPAPLKWELDLVGLATVADMVPLTGENRALVYFGLKVLAKSRNCGLQALAEVAGLDLARVTARDIGFGLAPRLNAASRTHQEVDNEENIPLRLLVGSTFQQEKRDAEHLNRCNLERQETLKKQLNEATAQVEKQLNEPCIIVYDPAWSSGVIGLIAGRLAETYSRPTIALADEQGHTKGSVRSIGQINTVSWLAKASPLLERYGGHAKAGGLSLHQRGKAAVDELRSTLTTSLVDDGWNVNTLAKSCQKVAELHVELKSLTEELAGAFQQLAPYGIGFEQPLIESTVTVLDVRQVGKEGEHLQFRFGSNSPNISLKGIAFGMKVGQIVTGAEAKVLLELQIEEWQGRRSVSAIVRRLDLL